MPTAEPERGPDEIARLGAQVLDRSVRPLLRPEDDGKFIAIAIDSGEYELDEDDYAAVMRLRRRRPSAEIWLARVGQPAAHRIRHLCRGSGLGQRLAASAGLRRGG